MICVQRFNRLTVWTSNGVLRFCQTSDHRAPLVASVLAFWLVGSGKHVGVASTLSNSRAKAL
jgi:hypothetical protein